jgi:hypothetical protein
MTVATLVLLGALAVVGTGLSLRGERLRTPAGAVVLLAGLAGAAVLAWRAGEPSDVVTSTGVLLAVAAAAAGGGPVTTAVLRLADPDRGPSRRRASDPEVLRGGAWIGVLERIAVAATLLGGWPEGLAVLIAVKGLGRFNELKAPVAAERFIIGTLASGLWAIGCAGAAVLLRR